MEKSEPGRRRDSHEVYQDIKKNTLSGDMSHKSGKFDDAPPSAAELISARNEEMRKAAAFQPTSDMYLNRRTAEAADEMQKISDQAASNAREINQRKKNLYDDLNAQRRTTNKAFLDTVLATPSTPYAPNYADNAWAERNEKEKKLREEEAKLHAMGGAGDYEIIPGAINSAHAGYVNAVGTLNDYLNQYHAAPTVFNSDGTVNWEASARAHRPSETVQAAVDKAHNKARPEALPGSRPAAGNSQIR